MKLPFNALLRHRQYLFDAASKSEEYKKHPEDLIRWEKGVVSANIFDTSSADFSKSWDSVDGEWLIDNLFLPFPDTYVDVGMHGVLLLDDPSLNKHFDGNTRGAKAIRHFITSAQDSNGNWGHTAGLVSLYRKGSKEYYAYYSSEAASDKDTDNAKEGNVLASCWFFGYCIVSADGRVVSGLVDKRAKDMSAQMLEYLGKDKELVASALKSLVCLNTPEVFILKESPAQEPRLKQGEAAKQHQRPVYRFVKPREIRMKMGLEEPKEAEPGSKKGPHERRAHLHTYRCERYTKMRGKTVVFPACWVGPSEATRGGKIYKVMLDM